MSWLLLILAGLVEVVWAVGLKYTDGFTRLLPSVLVTVAMAVSLGLLGLASRNLPIGTAYAIWVGIGAVGTVVAGIMLFHEPLGPAKIVFVAMLVVAVVGLKITA